MRIPKDGDIYYWMEGRTEPNEMDRLYIKEVKGQLMWARIMNSKDRPTDYPNILKDHDIYNLNRWWTRKNSEIIKRRLGIK